MRHVSSRVLAVVVTPTFPIGLVGYCSVFFSRYSVNMGPPLCDNMLHRSKSRYKLSPHTATRENAAFVFLVVLIQRICLNIRPCF